MNGEPSVRSAAMSDALDAAGHRARSMWSDITALERGSACAGPAVTVQFAPSHEVPTHPYDDMIAIIDALPAGCIVVIATDPGGDCAYWGELFSAAARGRGAAGVICDGPVRDSAQIRALDFPVFARGQRPGDYQGRARVVDHGVPIRCGGVMVRPGDLVVADGDGIVVAAAQHSDALDAARLKLATEATALDELLDGATLRDIWDRHRVL